MKNEYLFVVKKKDGSLLWNGEKKRVYRSMAMAKSFVRDWLKDKDDYYIAIYKEVEPQ